MKCAYNEKAFGFLIGYGDFILNQRLLY